MRRLMFAEFADLLFTVELAALNSDKPNRAMKHAARAVLKRAEYAPTKQACRDVLASFLPTEWLDTQYRKMRDTYGLERHELLNVVMVLGDDEIKQCEQWLVDNGHRDMGRGEWVGRQDCRTIVPLLRGRYKVSERMF